jgi:hypothetical protein
LVIVATTWRHSSHDMPGPSVWDYKVHALGYDRRSPWRSDDLGGFSADVQRITRRGDE